MTEMRELRRKYWTDGSVRLAHTCNSSLDDGECMACGARDCPHGEPLHYHHDGCPACAPFPMLVDTNKAKEGS